MARTKNAGLIKRFLPYYKPHLRIFIFDLACALGVAITGLIFPMLVRYLLNNVDMYNIKWMFVLSVAAVMLFVRLLELLFNYYMTTVGHVMGSMVEATLRRELYGKLLALSSSFYDHHQTGELMSRVNNDLFEITEFAHHCPEEILLAAARIIGVFTYLMFIDPILTLFLFAMLPPIIFFAVVSNRRMKKKFAEQRVKISQINAHLEDSLAGISVIRAYGNEERELDRFENHNREFVDIKRHTYKIMGQFHGGMLFASGLMYVVVVVLGVFFISKARINTVDLLTYMLYVGTLLSTVQTITSYFEQFQRGMSGFRRFLEIIDEPLAVVSPDDPAKAVDFTADIEFSDVTFAYDKKRPEKVLKHLNFTIHRGEHIAIVGASGSGKTTVAKLIPRFYDVEGGKVTIGGVSVADMDLNTLRDNIGSVQQDVYLFYGSVKENILFGRPDATDEEVIEAAKKANAHEFISQLPEGYDTVCGERGVMLSGGQKQRISIARLFLKNPPILILDEATSALDNENELMVQRSLEALSKGRTTLTIAHRLTTVIRSDRILVLGSEGIVEEGTHEDLLNLGGVYAGLYKLYTELG